MEVTGPSGVSSRSGPRKELGLNSTQTSFHVTLDDVKAARNNIKSKIRRTELVRSAILSEEHGDDVFLKLENTQYTGSFKLRGAFNKIMSLTAEERARGVIASSAGNHAQGVAFSARDAGVKCTIVMPENAPLIKVQSTLEYGAEVIQHGEIYDDAFEKATELAKERGYVFIPPYQDPKIIAGQGTIALEMLEDEPELDTLIVAIGGGGLISGIALAAKALRPSIRVIGVQSSQVDSMYRMFRGEKFDNMARIATIADGIAVKKPSPLMYENFIKKYVDEIVTVSDDEIAEAIVFLMEKQRTVGEGAGAAALAALIAKKAKPRGKTAVVIGGGNIDLNIISRIVEKGLVRKGRLVELSMIVDDLPGSLNRLTNVLAENRANVLEVRHDRVSLGLDLRQTRIEFVIETTSREHVVRIREALRKAGARLDGPERN